MNTEMIAVYVVVAAIVILPYLAFLFLGSGKHGKLLKAFKNTVQIHKLNISDKESWNRHIMGIDVEKRKFLFMQVQEMDNPLIVLIDLREVQSIIKIINKNGLESQKFETEGLQYLGLEFVMKDHTNKKLCFYDAQVDISQNYEHEHVEKWMKFLQKLVQTPLEPDVKAA